MADGAGGRGTPAPVGLTEAVGAFVAGLKYDALPPQVVDELLVCLDFNLGIARAGFPLVATVTEPYVASGGGGPATVWTGRRRGGTEQVAFANAVATHARSQDDFLHLAAAHVGAVSVPAVLAMAEETGAGGRDVIVALAAAYQVTAALAVPAVKGSAGRGLRATPLYGPLGAAAACAWLGGGSQEQIAAAVGLAAHTGAGFNQPWIEGTPEWRIHPGTASQSAVRCARLALFGAVASPYTLEGPFGFYAASAGLTVDPRVVAQNLEEQWLIAHTRLKTRPVCGLNQGPAATAARLARELDCRPGDLGAVRLEMRSDELGYPGISERGPFGGPGAALMSAPYVVATALCTGDVTFAALERPAMPEVTRITAAMELRANDDLSPLGHVLTVTDRAGEEHSRASAGGAADADEAAGADGALTATAKDAILSRVAAEVDDPRVASPARARAVIRLPEATGLGELLSTL